MTALAERVVETDRHRTFYLECGPADGPLLIFVHGWPALAISWRAQLARFAELGYRCVAPDMRGYGGSSAPPRRESYALEEIVADLRELLAALGAQRAVWIGHDWGGPAVWEIARHHPEVCRGVASACVPYAPDGFTPASLIPLVDRNVYPEGEYPAGQWDYMLYYASAFDDARATFEADVSATVRALFRSGNPKHRGRPEPTARITADGGWFGGAGCAPDLPRDPAILSEDDLRAHAGAFERTGFFGADAWYVNPERNAAYARTAAPQLAMPVLFLHALYDTICETVDSRLAEPMRRACANLTERILETGHWLPQEQPAQCNAALEEWLDAQRLR
jgi:pimeloyl-ACP methyl ester carboxylesterase